ncbi:hypothetical protein FRC0420_00219 [Corynebacterium diphtheriae]|nr:hypothetical protein FRC0420_00219 [Corynebacterium diphtheriae]
MLLHAFIDESEYRDKYFILSALIVEDDKLKQLNSDLKALLSDYCRGYQRCTDLRIAWV